MPTYSYACTECSNRFDVVQAFSDDALTTCEKCSGRLRKVFGNVGVVFKGSGFYRTDSRESTKSPANGSAKRVEFRGHQLHRHFQQQLPGEVEFARATSPRLTRLQSSTSSSSKAPATTSS